jgi:hypothetical protein
MRFDRSTAVKRRGQPFLRLDSRIESLEQRLVLTPTSEEQLFVYLLNQARHDPQAYADHVNLPVSLDGVAARQPLSVNDDLFASAQFHAKEMADHNYFNHQSDVTGDWPNKIARDQGYNLPASFPDDNNYIESIAAGNLYGNPADVLELLIVDAGIPSLGHRNHLLGIDSFNAQATEIGVGHGFNLSSFYDHYWAIHATYSNQNDTFLTGVVYNDANNDNAFSLNEGLAGVTISVAGTGLQTQTNAAGGWSIKVANLTTYTVNVSGGAFAGTASSIVQVGTDNREVDFISGDTAGVVDFEPIILIPNAPPVNAVPASPFDVQEDLPTAFIGISVSDPDAGTNNVSVTLDVAHGIITVATNLAGGLTAQQVAANNSAHVVLTGPLSKINATLSNALGVMYRGASNFNGSDTLSMTTSDLGNSGTGGAQTDFDTVAVIVNAVNDPPVNTLPSGPLSVVTGANLTVAGLSLADADLGVQPAGVTLNVLHGIVTLRTDVASGLTAADVVGNGSAFVTITAPLSRLLTTLAASNGLVYSSDIGYVGPDSLTMISSDQGGSDSGPVGLDQDSVAIQVQPTPIAPTLFVPATTVSSPNGAAVIVGSGATITDPDSPSFASGRLTIQITAGAGAKDILTLHKDVCLGKSVIGHLSGGTGSTPLVIQFTSNVTLGTVQTVLRNVTLKAKSGRMTAGTRTISFAAKDPTQLSSQTQLRQATVPG